MTPSPNPGPSSPPPAGEARPAFTRRLVQRAGVVFAFIVFGAAIWALHEALADMRMAELLERVRAIPALNALGAVMLTGLSYGILYIFDTTAFAYIGTRIDHGRVAVVSFMSYAFSHNLGFGALTGGAVRLRFYTRWGVSALDVAKVVLFAGLTYYLSAFAIAGILMQFSARGLSEVVTLPIWAIRLIGGICTLTWILYGIWSWRGGPVIRLRGTALVPPKPGLCAAQIAVAFLEWWFVSGVLYLLLLPSEQAVPYFYFVTVYVIAYVAGLLSHVPGGLGVFESVLVLLLRDTVGAEALVAAIILYRLIYYILPLLAGLVLFVVMEVGEGRLFARRRKPD